MYFGIFKKDEKDSTKIHLEKIYQTEEAARIYISRNINDFIIYQFDEKKPIELENDVRNHPLTKKRLYLLKWGICICIINILPILMTGLLKDRFEFETSPWLFFVLYIISGIVIFNLIKKHIDKPKVKSIPSGFMFKTILLWPIVFTLTLITKNLLLKES